MNVLISLPIAAALFSTAWGQKLDLSSLDKLSGAAKESSYVNLDGDRLKTALAFLSQPESKDKNLDAIKGVVSDLKGVYVRSLEFDKAGAFTQADLEPIRRQLRAQGWARVVEVKERDGESNEIYFYKLGNNAGMAVVSVEKQELTVVNLVGPLDLSALTKIGGLMNLPSIQSRFGQAGLSAAPGGAATGKQQEDDEDEN